ncbi:MAG: TAXI family TRAP transporter solute-binding subunit [Dethiobacter sp.]|jgi:TRAP transporter TAXI family solute receptor|nr:TAXI family TRAP transporter solute-binding subunit [Dethiobacter sp.]
MRKIRRQKRNLLWVVVMLAVLVLMLAACGQKPAPTPAPPAPQTPTRPSIEWPSRMSIATGGTGGTYFPYGGGMANIISEKVSGFTATAEVTGASVENIRLVHSQDAEIALIMGDVGYQAFHGEGRFEKDAQDILIMFQMYPNIYHVVTLEDFGINSISDVKGKRVSIGAPGSGTEYKTSLVFDALGIKYEEFTVERLSFAEQTDAMKDRNLEVGIWSVGPPTSSILNLATTHKVKILPFSDAEIKKVTAAHPFYTDSVVAGGLYPGVPNDVRTLAVWNSVIVHRDAPEEKVYQIVKAMFENVQDLIDIHPVAEWTIPENTLKYSTMALHPGTIRYLEEIGLKVPDSLRP